MKNIVYRFSSKFFLTKNITRKIYNKLCILYPSNKQSIIRRTSKYLIRLYAMCFMIAAGLFLLSDFSVYYTVLTAFTVYFVYHEKIVEEMIKLDEKILAQLLKFVEDVKFRFQFDGMLEQALIDSINDADMEMSAHGQKIYECLQESYYFDRQEYIEISPNHYFLTFYSLCEAVMLYGDKKDKECSVFSKNLGYLKEEINIELLKRQKIKGNFIGLKAICLFPVFFIKPIEKWAESNVPEISDSFTSNIGVSTTIILFVLSLLAYKVVNVMKYGFSGKTPSVFIKNMTTKRYIDIFVRKYISLFIKKSNSINEIIKDVSYDYNIREYTFRRFCFAISTFLIILATFICSKFTGVFTDISLVLGCVFSIGSAFFVFLMMPVSLALKKRLLLLEREEEIVRFQNIILMMMHMDRVTIEQILTEMERFARVFKKQLEKVVDKYTYKGIDVFIEAKSEISFRPFERLMDGFIACDETYIEVAFDDIEKDRRYFLERHKQENDRIISDKTTIAKIVSFLPLCAVIAFKLIIPFVLQGLSALENANF